MIRIYTDHPSELIQTKKEPFRNKHINLEVYYNKEDAIFVLIYLFI